MSGAENPIPRLRVSEDGGLKVKATEVDFRDGLDVTVVGTVARVAIDATEGFPLVNQVVGAGEEITIPSNFCLVLAGPMTISGIVNNSGTRMVI